MPYIEKEQRAEIDKALEPLWPVLVAIGDAGSINYILTRICGHWLQRYALTEGVRYEHFNAVIGALECAKLEFVRRAVAPYEDRKIRENGDVLEYLALKYAATHF